MNPRLATITSIALAFCAASSTSALPGGAGFITTELLENVPVVTREVKQAAKMGFGQPGPVDVMSATTNLSGAKNRLEFYAGTKGFVVNRIGAVYDLETGAVLKLRDGVSLTGSYRMLGYDFLATGSENTEPQFSGTFLGLQLDF